MGLLEIPAMRWLWGHIYSENDYRKALVDSDCYNMFLECLMLKLSVVGAFTQEQSLGIPTGEVISVRLGKLVPPVFNIDGIQIPFSRDWYKGFGDTAIKIPQGWVWIQRYIDALSTYYVRTLDENGEINYNGRSHLLSWNSFLFESPTLDRYGNILYTKPTNCLPYNRWWTRKYYRSISSLAAMGEPGDRAKLIVDSSNLDSNQRGMNGWIFKMNDSHKWRYDPTAIAGDLIESKGPIQFGDTPGPWILNDLKQALDELHWTFGAFSNDLFEIRTSSTTHTGLSNTGKLAFNGFDKIQFKDESFSINGSSHSTHDTSLNDPLKANVSRFSYYQLWWHYFELIKFAGIHPAGTPYLLGGDFRFAYPMYLISNFPSNLYAPGDKTSILGSWPQPAHPTYLGNWSSGDVAGILSYTKAEGTPRNVEFYSPPIGAIGLDKLTLLHTSAISTTWNYNYTEGESITSALSIVKWKFKYSRDTPNATFSGIRTAFMSILE
jgi:hypothetical protein